MIFSPIYRVAKFAPVIITLLMVTASEDLQSEILFNSSITSLQNYPSQKQTTDKGIQLSFSTSSLNVSDASPQNSTVHWLQDDCPELDCVEAVFLELSEYTILDDGSLHAHVHNVLFEKCEYLDLEDGVGVCHSKLLGSEIQHDRILATITVIGLSTSVLFLILHLVLFLIIPEMKNLPGCCLASLCVSLVLGYVHFLIATTVGHMSETPCVAMAICIYYFFMASFFWMNAIAFDVWRSLREATTHLRAVENKFPRKRFLLYSAYAWLTPMAFAILTHQIDSSHHIPEKYRPRFADSHDGWCWFRETHSLLLLFITPFALLMGLNILFFGVSTYIILTASFNSSQANRKMLISKFFLFLRLALLMGLTWVSAILVHFTQYAVFSYVFVVSNAFQGSLIFLAFSCKKKVKENFSRRMGTFSSQRTSRNTEFFSKSTSTSSVTREKFKKVSSPDEFKFEFQETPSD